MKVNFKEIISTVAKFNDEHKPEIATGAGIVLMVAGAVGCVAATLKTVRAIEEKKTELALEKKMEILEKELDDESIDEETEEYDEIMNNPLPFKVVALVAWKYWIGPVGAIATGIFCLIFSNRESARRIGLLTSALSYQLAEAKDYKEAAKELFGEEKEKKIEEEQTKKTAERRRVGRGSEIVVDTGTGEQYYEEYYTGTLLKASPEYIESCLNELNALINEKRHYLPNDDYDLFMKNDISACYVTISEWCNILSLQIQTTGLTEMFGFDVTQGLAQLSFSNADVKRLDNARSCIILRFSNGNVPDYIEI